MQGGREGKVGRVGAGWVLVQGKREGKVRRVYKWVCVCGLVGG